MKLYSQRDPAYSSLKLGSTTIYKDGCVVQSLATLFQVDPEMVLSIKGAINSRGECDIKRVVESLGGTLPYRGKNAPMAWCLAKTTYYKNKGVPTHYFPYHPYANQCIDPLLFPAGLQKNMYPIAEYIWLTGVKLDFQRETLENKLKLAEQALQRNRLTGTRKGVVVRFIERIKKILSSPFSL